MALHNEIGKLGEKIAVKYLNQEGYYIVEKNYRNKFGEIDIIASKKSCTVFVEVKSRSSENYINLVESLNQKQIHHIRRAAIYYLAEQKIHFKTIRFDLITLKIDSSAKKIDKLNHYKNIID